MPINKEETIQVKVSMPREIHRQLKEISQARGIPMSTLLLMAALEKYFPKTP